MPIDPVERRSGQDAQLWESAYLAGHGARWPWDAVVSFLFRIESLLPSLTSGETRHRLLEIGCGAGANLLAASERGFATFGIDRAPSAVRAARALLMGSADGHLTVADSARIPFENSAFDVVIDRAAITHSSPSGLAASLREVDRVLRPSGFFFFNPFSSGCSAATYADEFTEHMKSGRHFPHGQFRSVGTVTFLERDGISAVLDPEIWRIISAVEVTSVPLVSSDTYSHPERISDLRVVAQKR